MELLEAAPERCEPPCPHFGPCGGCSLQHMENEAYRSWKLRLLTHALERAGIAPARPPKLLTIAPGSRRRADFAFRKVGNSVVLGFHERGTHRILDLHTCLLLTPTLKEALPGLRHLLMEVCAQGEVGEAVLLESETGIDLLVCAPSWPDLAVREVLSDAARTLGLARISWGVPGSDPEPIVELRPPRITLSGFEAFPPAGAFLQPSHQGEKQLVEQALAYLPPASNLVFDLFAGLGTFTFAFAERGIRVHAVEGDGAALGALWATARRNENAAGVTAEHRDLARQPLKPDELAGADAVLFDPPRAGAREQAAQIAVSDIETVISVSCNPATFARDARILEDGGFRLLEAVAVDQFPWSGHLEVVAHLRKP